MEISKKIDKSNATLKLVFSALFMIAALFFSDKVLEYPIYISVSKTIVYLLLLFSFVLIILLLNEHWYVDLICIMLMIRGGLYLIPLIYTENIEGYLGNYLAVIASCVAYFIGSQLHFKDISKKINYIFFTFVVLVSFQVIYQLILIYSKYGSLEINLKKHYLVLPIGGSNYIACIILPLLIFLLHTNIDRKWKFVGLLISLAGLILIQSKNAILVLTIFISGKLIFSYLKKVRSKKYSLNKGSIVFITLILLSAGLFFIYYIIRYFIINWNMGTSYADNATLYEIINALSSYRLDVYFSELGRWTNHIFLGNGLGYSEEIIKSHNWIIDLLVQSGIFGLGIFCIALFIWYKKVVKHLKDDPFIKACFYSCIVILIQGLAEVSLFTLSIDILFWFIIGLSVSQVNYKEQQQKLSFNWHLRSIKMMFNKKYRDKEPIDFVITWVDGGDPIWIKDKEKHSASENDNKNNVRYRDWDNLQYWFRGVEKFTPWVNKIHIITYGHLPKWLNINHPKLNIVNHKEYIPEEYLPTFSSHPIELHLHRIKGLSEQFVYFNDDMFITKNMDPSDFFYKGLPCDSLISNAQISHRDGVSSAINNNMEIINDHFNKREQFRRNISKHLNVKYGFYNLRTLFLMPWRHFTGFYDQHLPISYLKSTFNIVWNKEKKILDSTSENKFRTKEDVNNWVFRYWQLASGNFYPRTLRIGKYYYTSDDNSKIISDIKNQAYKLICINDNSEIKDFDKQKELLKEAFNQILFEKSEFELDEKDYLNDQLSR